ncbi:hypothetical protein ORV05_16850 [Amycolatopsis cynarae]|uniref:Uncharacterized protein n=1 Tax=Amycolatopsis cynarae TaxID=2995223 RepID=A0ABY7BDN1_9PSEU|nr:hypothetical protein [Amycolatopsis sp. HUAS 11-8]WAL69367.1 hypothetical protein ORV05_16850 [Amycolatopsis sp. HUAS 11-8]
MLVYDELDDPRPPTVTSVRLRDAGNEISRRFVDTCVHTARHLHTDGHIRNSFGRPIPVLVHYDTIAAQTEAANPPGLPDDFVAWVHAQ